MFNAIKAFNAFGVIEKAQTAYGEGRIALTEAQSQIIAAGQLLQPNYRARVLADVIALNLAAVDKEWRPMKVILESIAQAGEKLAIAPEKILNGVLVPFAVRQKAALETPAETPRIRLLQSLFQGAAKGQPLENHLVAISPRIGSLENSICIVFKSVANEPPTELLTIAEGRALPAGEMYQTLSAAWEPEHPVRHAYLDFLSRAVLSIPAP